ncbi:MAG: 23S rRNA (pseudouridine(1915)-N(3))-methyltransferase RlmH [Desulfobacteraceae bacterium]|nr:MAG: 23S rRNA (pseudouridine(1915)-N(3))-methyltransferase RlmH [Desulfobacteraceae bacterium]
MLRIKLIVVDRTRQQFLREGEAFYIQRIRRYAGMEWEEVKPAKIKKGRTEEEILGEEAENILKRVVPKDYTVAMERTARSRTSGEMALWLEALQQKGVECVAFLIGGPLGLASGLLSNAREKFSLSRLTLTHEMSRLVLLEQIYRSFTILRGEKYHK